MDGHAAGFARAQAETVRQAVEALMKAREIVGAVEQQHRATGTPSATGTAQTNESEWEWLP
jgi:hypothetical protein